MTKLTQVWLNMIWLNMIFTICKFVYLNSQGDEFSYKARNICPQNCRKHNCCCDPLLTGFQSLFGLPTVVFSYLPMEVEVVPYRVIHLKNAYNT
jgi:hypothetical protein